MSGNLNIAGLRLTGLVLLALAGLPGLATAQEADPPIADLRVTVSARSRALKTPLEPFAAELRVIDTVVKNVSSRPRTIIAWTQYGWSWVSNSAQVSPGIEAAKNASETIVLGPGQSFNRAVEVYVVGARPVTFRLGFYAAADGPVSARVPPIPIASITWSNAIRLRH